LMLAPQPVCSWNDSFEPGAASQAAIDAAIAAGIFDAGPPPHRAPPAAPYRGPPRPVACVRWCGAARGCAWGRKRLCGKVGGGGYDVTDGPGPHADPAISEWFGACTGPSVTAYPYGSTYEAGRCNDKMSGPKSVGSAERCEGGFPTLFDMSGNVGE